MDRSEGCEGLQGQNIFERVDLWHFDEEDNLGDAVLFQNITRVPVKSQEWIDILLI